MKLGGEVEHVQRKDPLIFDAVIIKVGHGGEGAL